jgi:4-diphosphocytidyl-2-C-methyl-D-erythritol kinase
MAFSVTAPAKLNRYLGVLGRRPDGFHEVELVTTVLDHVPELCDTLSWEPHHRLELRLEGPTAEGLVADESNLVLKAWRLVESYVGRPCPARLLLHKRIPHGAGLGGGSSDAAAALKLANQCLALELPDEVLLAFAAELGSDVPLFLLGGTVHGTGRGERVRPIAAEPLPPLLLVHPRLHQPTAGVYGALARTGLPSTLPLPDPARAPWVNDLEAPALAVNPALAEVREALVGLGGSPLLCGSGSAWAARFDTLAQRDAAQATLAAAHPHWGFWSA